MKFLKNIGFYFLCFLAFLVYNNVLSALSAFVVFGVSELLVALAMLVVGALMLFGYWKWYKHQPSIELKESIFNRYTWLPILLYVIYFLIETFFPFENSNNQNTIIQMAQQVPLITGVMVVFSAPIVEELFFRGFLAKYLFAHQDATWKSVLYVLVSGTIFSLAHGPSTIPQFLLYFSMGAIFALAYLARKDIRYPMAIHMVNNLIGFIFIIAA